MNSPGMETPMRTTLIAVLLSVGALTACQTPDPCGRLAPPTRNEIAAAGDGAEVEREISGVECVVVGGRWVRDRES